MLDFVMSVKRNWLVITFACLTVGFAARSVAVPETPAMIGPEATENGPRFRLRAAETPTMIGPETTTHGPGPTGRSR